MLCLYDSVHACELRCVLTTQKPRLLVLVIFVLAQQERAGMKFGKYLEANKEPAWAEYYLQYGKLKHIIKDLQAKNLQSPGPDTKNVSLSVPAPTNAAGVVEGKSVTDVNQEAFFTLLESEMKKIEDFTLAKVQDIR